jgi:hypothetical protein
VLVIDRWPSHPWITLVNGHRDATMILLTFRHGLRAAEVCDLRWAIGHLLFGLGKYSFQPIGVTASGIPFLEFIQPVELSLHGYGIR